MKTLYHCSYCHYKHEDSKVAEDHEKNCLYNPFFKGCFSCLFQGISGMFEPNCKKYNNATIARINCPDWETNIEEKSK